MASSASPQTQPAPKPATAKRGAKQQPEPEIPNILAVIDLNAIQEQAIDLVVDLIVHGGAQDDVQSVIVGALGHWYRRKFDDDFEDAKKMEENVTHFVWKREPEWEGAVQAGRFRNPRRNLEALVANTNLENTATGLTRAHTRNGLIGEFEEFLVDGTPEELELLRTVLEYRDQMLGDASVALAESFSYQIDRHADYVKVRPDLAKQVKAYIAALEAIPQKAKVA